MMRTLLLIVLVCGFCVSTGEGFFSSLINNNDAGVKALVGTERLIAKMDDNEWRKDVPIVIVPGFGNDEIDYVAPLEQSEDVGLVSVLKRRGFTNVRIVPVKRLDWLRVAGGLIDIPNFYTNQALPTGPGYGWFIRRIQQTVQEAYDETSNDTKVVIMAHSAGGWLARAAMADNAPNSFGDNCASDCIQCLVTLGAVHKSPVDPTTCVTRGALSYTATNYPGAFLQDLGISYISVGGNAVTGKAPDAQSKQRGPEQTAFNGYRIVSGIMEEDAKIRGDGVVPLEWTLLEGSQQLILDDVLHSINEAGTSMPTDRWYGSEGVVDRWLPTLIQQIYPSDDNDNQNNSFFQMPEVTIPNWFSLKI